MKHKEIIELLRKEVRARCGMVEVIENALKELEKCGVEEVTAKKPYFVPKKKPSEDLSDAS